MMKTVRLLFLCVVSALLGSTTTTAMAQVNPVVEWRYSARFPEMPPMKVDFNPVLFTHYQPNLLQSSQEGTHNRKTVTEQSMMIQHKEGNANPHIRIKPTLYSTQSSENLKGVRDRIVRDRRRNEPNPLPPPVPRR